MKIATPAIVAGFFPVRISNFEILSAVALHTSYVSWSRPSFFEASSGCLDEVYPNIPPGRHGFNRL